MSYFDIVVAIPLLWALYKGFRKGLIIEVASLVALILGIWGGLSFSDYAADLIHDQLEVSSEWLPLLSFALTFIAIVVAIFALAKVLEKIIKMVALGMVNRLLGALFGFLKVALICSVVVYVMETINLRFRFLPHNIGEKSVLYAPLSRIAPAVIPLFTEWQKETVIPGSP